MQKKKKRISIRKKEKKQPQSFLFKFLIDFLKKNFIGFRNKKRTGSLLSSTGFEKGGKVSQQKEEEKKNKIGEGGSGGRRGSFVGFLS